MFKGGPLPYALIQNASGIISIMKADGTTCFERMEETIKEKIFEPFFTTKMVGKGSGPGLAIAYGIVKQHNGYIDAECMRHKGTTFRIYLPAGAQVHEAR